MAKLVVREGPGARAEHEIRDTPVKIGRKAEAGILVPDPKASRLHAEVARRESALVVRDLESNNGTFVNGRRIEGETILKPGDRIRVGDTVLELVGERGEGAIAVAGTAAAGSAREGTAEGGEPQRAGRRQGRKGGSFVSRLATIAGVATFLLVGVFVVYEIASSRPAKPFGGEASGRDDREPERDDAATENPTETASPADEMAPVVSEAEATPASPSNPDHSIADDADELDAGMADEDHEAPLTVEDVAPVSSTAVVSRESEAAGPVGDRVDGAAKDEEDEKADPLARALATLPPTEKLVGELRSWLVKNARKLAGAGASLKVGRGQATRAKLASIDDKGVRGRAGPLELSATWEKLGPEGVYVLCRSLVAKARPDVHAKHLLLGLRLGLGGSKRYIADELDDGLSALWEKDAATARHVDESLKRIRSAKATKLARAAGERKGPPKAFAKEALYAEAPASYELVFPPRSGHRDVKAEYGAAGDGKADDTAALLKAMSENLDYHSKMLFVPRGTYLVTDTLVSKLPSGSPYFGTQLVGQNREHTVIKLQDNCPGFQDPAKPKAVVKLCSRDQLDGGNMGHKNFMQNLTIDTGEGNPGAAGVDYCASNTGAIRDVTFRSGDGAGVCGIDMTKPWPGPCLVTNVLVQGFDYGIMVAHSEYSVTFEHITLEKQRVCGFKNDGNVICMRKLRSLNAGPAVDSKGMLILLDSELKGAGVGPAVKSRGLTYLRNVKAENYTGVIVGQPNIIAEYCSKKPKGLFPTLQRSLCLPVEDTPFVPYDPPALCVVAGRNIQAALDSGKPTVIIPFGEYRVNETLVIRGNVRRIHAMNSNVWAGDRLGNAPIWRYEGTRHPAVVMEWMDSGTVVHASKNALVIRDCTGLAPRNVPGAGPLFVENDCSDPWVLEHPQKVWGRSINLEHAEFDIKNHGAWLWILGFKSERPGMQIETTGGGYTEVLGGLVYPCKAVPADRPMFVNDESGLSVMVRQTSYVANGIHRIKVKETRDGVTKMLEDLGESLYSSFKVPPEVAEKRAKEDGKKP